jgi:hypothetical protein
VASLLQVIIRAFPKTAYYYTSRNSYLHELVLFYTSNLGQCINSIPGGAGVEVPPASACPIITVASRYLSRMSLINSVTSLSLETVQATCSTLK